ncbi:MAG: ribosome maturation factor RimP [Magnetococcales bacterium]|nr:ribosome maturation factor RimP [Magnetococcales bacterium]
MSSVLEKVTTLAQQAVQTAGCELVDVQYVKDGRTWYLRLFVEREGGASPTLEDCARVSDHMEGLLDVNDPLPHAYRLEVSSPGLNRVLKKREDFLRFTGRKVVIQSLQGVSLGDTGSADEKRRNFKGVLHGVEEDNVVIMVQGMRLAIPLAVIGKANLELEF